MESELGVFEREMGVVDGVDSTEREAVVLEETCKSAYMARNGKTKVCAAEEEDTVP